MEIVFFHRKDIVGAKSIEISFQPLIESLSKDNDVKVFHVPFDGSNPIKMLKNIMFIRKNSTKNGINHITGDIHYGVIGLISRKSILTIHDDYAVRAARRGPLDKLYKWIFWLWIPTKLASACVCITYATKNKLVKLHIKSKLEVITHHVVSPLLSNKNKTFDKSCPRILQFGTANSKNMYSTVKALKNIPCILIVMKNKMTEEQIDFVQSMGVKFENKYEMDYKDVIAEYDNCDIVVFPSLYEGFGLPIIEAQASGKPVITTNDEPMNWVAGKGALLLNNPLDINEFEVALRKIIDNDDYRTKLITEGTINVKRFNIGDAEMKYFKLYKRVLGEENGI